jgi:hypothetical protein
MCSRSSGIVNLDWDTKLGNIDALPSNVIFSKKVSSNTTLEKYKNMSTSTKSQLQPPVAVIILDSIIADMCIREMQLDYFNPIEFEKVASNLAQVPQMRMQEYMRQTIKLSNSVPAKFERYARESLSSLVGKFFEHDEKYVAAYIAL